MVKEVAEDGDQDRNTTRTTEKVKTTAKRMVYWKRHHAAAKAAGTVFQKFRTRCCIAQAGQNPTQHSTVVVSWKLQRHQDVDPHITKRYTFVPSIDMSFGPSTLFSIANNADNST
jgi:hypothetical protein